jgi:hypothetical protein
MPIRLLDIGPHESHSQDMSKKENRIRLKTDGNSLKNEIAARTKKMEKDYADAQRKYHKERKALEKKYGQKPKV